MKNSRFLLAVGFFVGVLTIIYLLYSCKKEFHRQAAVITRSMDVTTANAKATVIDLGRGTITDHGFCWDSMGNPTFEKSRLALGGLALTGDYQGQLIGLLPKKTYYLRAFVAFGENLEYGDKITFTTPDLPSLTTSIITDITQTDAKSGGEITSDGGAPVIARGVCWSTNNNPDLSNNHTVDSSGIGIFTSQMFGLNAGNLYYVRAYATNIYGTRYGNELSFTSGQGQTAPVITSKDVTSITQTTASCGGNVISDGGSTVTVRGVCWSITPYPTTDNNKTSDGSGTGEFTSSMTGLTANTTYYIRAYATNEKGTSYGDEKSFQTLSAPNLPTVTTKTVTNITQTSATSGGTVLTDGGASVTARGVCWGISPNPTISNTHTTDGSGVGTFTSSVTGLTANTKYYIRAYATNNAGTAYGNEIQFTAGQNGTSPTVTTTDVVNIAQTTATCGGNVTSDGGATVTARGVCWSTSANPTTANNHTTDGSGTGGYLSSLTGLTANTTYHVRAYATNSAGTSYGNEKVFTTLPEVTPPAVTTAPVTNITNNSSQSGGTVTNSGGATVTARGVCWSTNNNPTLTNSHTSDGTGTGSFISYLTGLNSNTFYYVRAYATNNAGTSYGNQQTFSTLSNPVLPTVTTAQVTNITQTTATSGGTVNSDGGTTVTARGICYSTNPNPDLSDAHTINGSGIGNYVSNLSNLTPGTMYYVRAYATNSVGTAYGNDIIFTTLSPPWQCGDTLQYAGQTYNTVLIGTQCWMKENINVGTMINGSQNQTNNGITEKYCYNNDPANCSVYGGLYQWDEMMQYITTEGTKGICKVGWHIPTDSEDTTLTSYLGGESVAGGKMKEIGTNHWMPPNTGATNESGFTGLPSGWRGVNAQFYSLTTHGSYSSSTECPAPATYAWTLMLTYNFVNSYISSADKYVGSGVRCIKN